MTVSFLPLYVTCGFFAAIIICLEIGWWIGQWHQSAGKWSKTGGIVVNGAMFVLLGLLVAFTFASAAQRFEARRHLIVQETNALGTAWLRLDLLAPGDQPAMRDLFRRYTDSRIAAYRTWGETGDMDAVRQELNNGEKMRNEIWTIAVAAANASASPAISVVLLPALNEMFDITTTRNLYNKMHTPYIIYMLIFALSMVGSVTVGYSMASDKKRSWIHLAGFAVILAVSMYTILELEYPRYGIIRFDAIDHALVNLRAEMK